MKKLLTLLTLLLCVVVGAKAETVTLLSYTVTSESTNGSDLTAGNGTIKFGAAKFEERTSAVSGYAYKMDGDSGTKYALLTLKTALAEGDKIIITGSQGSSNTTGYKFTDDTTPTTTYGTLAVAANKNEQTNTYTIPAGSGLIGKKGSASIWVVIPVPFHTAIEEFCSQDIGICPVEHTPLDGFGFVDSSLQ